MSLVLLVIFLLFLLMLYFLISRIMPTPTRTNKGYFSFYRSAYQQTDAEFDTDIEAVKIASQFHTIPEIELFERTDVNIVPVFSELVPEANRARMYWTIHNPVIHSIILGTKLYYNRARPYQVADINTLNSVSASTPSYPSGHAVQAFALAKSLTSQFPHKSAEINQLADKIADIRKVGGVHFPTDKEFARRLVDRMFWL
jgi:hypothetical protein